jgi:hypothetical protein
MQQKGLRASRIFNVKAGDCCSACSKGTKYQMSFKFFRCSACFKEFVQHQALE